MTSTASRQRRPPDNKPSQLLSAEENQILFQLIGRKCVSLASAVVQVLMSTPPSNTTWMKVYCGVVCFVKDSSYRSYFIRVFDIQNKCLYWEQELYSEFVYDTPRSFFHCFEADKCQVGLNFADQEEADLFKAAVNQKLSLRRQKIAEKRRAQETNGIKPSATGVTMSALGKSTESIARKKKTKNKEKKDTKKKITKADIGTPMDFIHVQHVGFDPRKGFDCMNSQEIDPQLKDFFNVAGVNQQHLADEKTRNFIYDFINKNGGIEALQKEQKAPPPIPARDVAPTPHVQPRLTAPAPPPPPARVPPPPMISPSRIMTAPPPPPPPSTTPRGVPHMHHHHHQRVPAIAVPAAKSSAPVPPPPPPPPPPPQMQPPAPPPPPPAQMGGCVPQGPDSRSALLDQIRKGAALHHVDATSIEPAPRQESSDSRGALLDQIRRGVELKTVSEQSRSRPPSPPILNGLAAALNKALQDRAKALQSSDDSDSEEDEDYDDDEWED